MKINLETKIELAMLMVIILCTFGILVTGLLMTYVSTILFGALALPLEFVTLANLWKKEIEK